LNGLESVGEEMESAFEGMVKEKKRKTRAMVLLNL
jgi:hypothetical protein